MADMKRVYVVWNGATGLPGVSVMYGGTASDPTGDILTFFNAVKAFFPTGLTWQVPNSGDLVNDTNGALTGGWTGTGGGTVTATGAGAYAAGCGCYVNWGTAGIVGGRRLRGRTFLAPLITGTYDSSGTITNANLTTIQAAATALAAASKLLVWHRPSSAGAGDGQAFVITSGLVPDQVTSLRTRRR